MICQSRYTDEMRREAALQVEMVRLGWGRDDPAFRRIRREVDLLGGLRRRSHRSSARANGAPSCSRGCGREQKEREHDKTGPASQRVPPSP